jgi:hypothetical protein
VSDQPLPLEVEAWAAALSCSTDEATGMWDRGSLLSTLLAVLVVRMPALADVAAKRPGADLARAVLEGWGDDSFTAAQLLAWSQALPRTAARGDLERAIRAACGAAEATPQRLGLALRRAAEAPSAGAQLVVVGESRGVTLWAARGTLRDQAPAVPQLGGSECCASPSRNSTP